MTGDADDRRLRVLIADDHPIFLAGLRTLLNALPHAHVVGEATTGSAAVAAARQLRPDVAIMDLDMPGMNGIEATRAIRQASPETAVLVLTMLEDDDSVFAAMRAGARGYLLKGAGLEEVGNAIEAVGRGDAIFTARVALRVFDYLTKPPSASVLFPELTDRERTVLELLADGHSNSAIARQLSLSVKTVRNYLSSIFAKLQVADRAEAAVRARRGGLGH